MMSEVDQKEQEKQGRLAQHKQELQAYGLRGLEGRMQHGLDPAAMMAVSEVRSKVEEVAKLVGADMTSVDALTKKLHVGGVWDEAKRLAAATDSDVVLWHTLGSLCHERNAAEDQLNDDGYLADVERVVASLEQLSTDMDKVTQAVRENVDNAKEKFQLVDGVAYAEGSSPFLSMAIAGETAGVSQDGVLFVGAEKVEFDALANQGYEKEEREDRGRMVTFWKKDGVDVVKVLYPGFGIVLNGDQKLALDLARSAQK